MCGWVRLSVCLSVCLHVCRLARQVEKNRSYKVTNIGIHMTNLRESLWCGCVWSRGCVCSGCASLSGCLSCCVTLLSHSGRFASRCRYRKPLTNTCHGRLFSSFSFSSRVNARQYMHSAILFCHVCPSVRPSVHCR